MLVISIFEKRATGLYHNTALVMDAGNGCAGFTARCTSRTIRASMRNLLYPGDAGGELNGFRPIQTRVGKLGLLVCWDQWYPEAARLMALAGADMLIYPTAIGWNPDDDEAEKQRQLGAWQIVSAATRWPTACRSSYPIAPAGTLHGWRDNRFSGATASSPAPGRNPGGGSGG